MAGKRRASPAKRLNVSQRMIKSNSSHTVFELWKIRTVWRCNVCIDEVQSNKTFHSSSIRLKIKLNTHTVLRADKTQHLASEYSSNNVLPVWQVHNRPAVYGCNQFWYGRCYLWRGRHLTQHQRLSRKKKKKEEQRSEVTNCWILTNMKQEGRVNIIIISCPRAPGLRRA